MGKLWMMRRKQLDEVVHVGASARCRLVVARMSDDQWVYSLQGQNASASCLPTSETAAKSAPPTPPCHHSLSIKHKSAHQLASLHATIPPICPCPSICLSMNKNQKLWN